MTDSSRYFNGMVGEVLIYDGSMEKEKRVKIMNELEDKWGGEAPEPPEPPVPPVPVNLSGEAASTERIDLSWGQSPDSLIVTGYYVFRDGVKIAEVADTFFIDGGLTPGTSYDYFIRSFDKDRNESGPSDTISVHTLSLSLNEMAIRDNHPIVYPNPAEGFIYVALPMTSRSEFMFELYSLKGGVVWSKEIHTSGEKTKYRLDLPNLLSGIYLYRITGTNIISHGRIHILKK
jgi:hypothetical protein